MEIKNLLEKLEGMHTIETAAAELHYTKQSTLNILSKLKREGFLTSSGGGRKKRLYKISQKKFRPRSPGMFDIINKYSPMKLAPWYDHQVHGTYSEEDALIDAVKTKSFRAILASLKLFNHIKDWKKLYALAKKDDSWQIIGALYDTAKIHMKVRKMPQKYYKVQSDLRWKQITFLHHRKNFPIIEKRWKVHIPFNKKDLEELA